MLRATLLVLSACFLASFALALDLPSYDDCRGKFYAIRKHEHFGWAEHMRELTPDDGELKEGERLAFQSTLGTFGDTVVLPRNQATCSCCWARNCSGLM